MINKLQTSKSYSIKNLSVKNYSGNTMLGTTVTTTFKEVPPVLEQVQGSNLLRNTDKKVIAKEFKFVGKLNIYLQCQLKSCNKKIPYTINIKLSPAHHVVPPRKRNHQRKICQQDFVLMLMALKPGSLHSLMCCNVFWTRRKKTLC